MPEVGNVRWFVEATDEGLIVSVEDEGPGIPDQEMTLVTNRFFRGRHKSTVGSGLGLSIVDLALRANGARLNLRNRTGRSGLCAQMIWHTAPPPNRSSKRELPATSQTALRLGHAS
jgi:two-component system sensor histidine kinase QseC